MPNLPSSGPIDILSIQNQFGGASPISMNEYYREGPYVTTNNTAIPKSGRISFSNFYDGGLEYLIIIESTTTNINLQTLFESTYPGSWASTIQKRLVINSGVIVGATNTSTYALNIPSGFGNKVTIENYGSIQAAGGLSNGANGGNAIYAGAPNIIILNMGSIYCGGGAGGKGGTGGSGYYWSQQGLGVAGLNFFYARYAEDCAYICTSVYGGSWPTTYCGGGCYTIISCPYCYAGITAKFYYAQCNDCKRTVQVITAGGEGGNGGRGQGYNQGRLVGSIGSSGGAYAGAGGDGGTGGTPYDDYAGNGEIGYNGSYTNGSAGQSGGARGYYIVNNSNVTWTATGTRVGRVG